MSHIERLAAYCDVRAVNLLYHLRVIDQPSTYASDIRNLFWLPDSVMRNVAYGTRIDVQSLKRMFLGVYSGKVFEDTFQGRWGVKDSAYPLKKYWISQKSSCVCPECIATYEGALQLQWVLPWSFACLTHNAVLLQYCSQCRLPLRSNIANGSRAFSITSGVPTPGHCENRLKVEGKVNSSGPKCGFPLSQFPTISIAKWPAMITAQKQLNSAMNGEMMMMGGRRVPSTEYLRNIKIISKLLLFASNIELLEALPEEVRRHIELIFADYRLQYENEAEFKRGGRICEPYLAYHDNVIMAAILPTATRIAASPTSSELATNLDRVLYHAFQCSRGQSIRVRNALSDRAFSDYLRFLIMEAAGISVGKNVSEINLAKEISAYYERETKMKKSGEISSSDKKIINDARDKPSDYDSLEKITLTSKYILSLPHGQTISLRFRTSQPLYTAERKFLRALLVNALKRNGAVTLTKTEYLKFLPSTPEETLYTSVDQLSDKIQGLFLELGSSDTSSMVRLFDYTDINLVDEGKYELSSAPFWRNELNEKALLYLKFLEEDTLELLLD